MPGVVRDGDLCSGHGGFPPRINSSASSTVFANGKGLVRVGDTWIVHTDGITSHSGTQVNGSTTVFCENQGVARSGDTIDCGSSNQQSSSSVFAG
jgi:hypothetical protein